MPRTSVVDLCTKTMHNLIPALLRVEWRISVSVRPNLPPATVFTLPIGWNESRH